MAAMDAAVLSENAKDNVANDEPPVMPYSPPVLPRLQQKALRQYARFYDMPPTVLRLARMSYIQWALLTGVCATVVLVFTFLWGQEAENYVWMIGGLFVGAISRDIGRFRMFVKIWPALRKVFNWHEIDALVGVPAMHKETPINS
jgi:hypothetical protein